MSLRKPTALTWWIGYHRLLSWRGKKLAEMTIKCQFD